MKTPISDLAISPGEFILEEMEARDWDLETLAVKMSQPLQLVNEIIVAKRAITPDIAAKLGDAFGISPQLWLSLESSYRLVLELSSRSDDEGPRHDLTP